jgi:hypothetical protein
LSILQFCVPMREINYRFSFDNFFGDDSGFFNDMHSSEMDSHSHSEDSLHGSMSVDADEIRSLSPSVLSLSGVFSRFFFTFL